MKKVKPENNKLIEIKKDKVVGNAISKFVGVTLVFFEDNGDGIQGILKSLVIETTLESFEEVVINQSKKMAENFGIKYIGLNDVFVVEGVLGDNVILGRSSNYNVNKKYKDIELKSIILKDDMFNEKGMYYRCNIGYKCINEALEEFIIEIIIVLLLDRTNYKTKINVVKETEMKNRIKYMSLDKLLVVEFTGITEICCIDSFDVQNLVFETLYADFKNLKDLQKNVISRKEVKEVLKDVFIL
ncbi:MAG: hypothetical protein LBI73_09670 [Myroides sp.]|nr:hypothetical protein [Myroides sp.]